MTSDLILFVEDNADFRDSAARFLELSKFEVVVASDGQEALDVLGKLGRIPDVIVSDISMPNMNGYEFFEAIRTQPHLQGVPFLFLTALDSRPDVRLGWEIGVDDYMVKPFRPEEFLNRIRSRLKRSRELRGLAERDLAETRNMLVRILSHELRTPLTYVTGGFTLLADEINNQETENNPINRQEVDTILDLIHNGTNRLNRLAEQTVMLAELMTTQSGESWDHMTAPIALSSIINMAVGNLSALATENTVTVEVGDVASLSVNGVESLLLTAITEPLRNAIQYSTEADSVVQIKAIVDPDDSEMGMVQISDQGRGINDDDLESIWELMIQSEREKYEQQGFGLGLPITQRIIQVHHGNIALDSKLGEGTTVTIRLPLRTEE
jgi:signal transduction histidine kinase